MDWAYSRPPVAEMSIERVEEAVHRRLCALIESQLDVFSAEEDRWSHLLLRIASSSACADWFVSRETWLYKKRLEASMASAPLIEDESELPWLCGRRPTRLARMLGARASPSGDTFSIHLHGGRKRRKRSTDWADCGDAVSKRLVRMERGEALFEAAGLFAIAASRFERCCRDDVDRASVILRMNNFFPSSESTRMCRLLARSRTAVETLAAPTKIHLRRLPTLRVDFDALILKKRRFSVRDSAARLPPCMTRMHLGLRRSHHLRHHARFQFATFLKSLGLSLVQVRELWRSEYVASNGAWSKRWEIYERQLRSLFENKRDPNGMLAHTCDAGMTEKSPTPRRRSCGDLHGCPFRFDDVGDLEDLLVKDMGLSSDEKDRVLSTPSNGGLSRERSCCARAFAALHKNPSSPLAADDEGRNMARPADWVYLSFKTQPAPEDERLAPLS